LQASKGPTKPITDAEALKTGAYGSMTNKEVKVLDLYAVLKAVEKVKAAVQAEGAAAKQAAKRRRPLRG